MVNQAPAGGSFDILLMIKYPSTEVLGPSKERYDAFMQAWGEANIESSNETVINLYNEIREIQGTYLVREAEIMD